MLEIELICNNKKVSFSSAESDVPERLERAWTAMQRLLWPERQEEEIAELVKEGLSLINGATDGGA